MTSINDLISVIADAAQEQGMNVFYIVAGDTGEYSDYRTWIAGGSIIKKVAEQLLNDLRDWARKNELAAENITYESYMKYCDCHDRHPFDPNFSPGC